MADKKTKTSSRNRVSRIKRVLKRQRAIRHGKNVIPRKRLSDLTTAAIRSTAWDSKIGKRKCALNLLDSVVRGKCRDVIDLTNVCLLTGNACISITDQRMGIAIEHQNERHPLSPVCDLTAMARKV